MADDLFTDPEVEIRMKAFDKDDAARLVGGDVEQCLMGRVVWLLLFPPPPPQCCDRQPSVRLIPPSDLPLSDSRCPTPAVRLPAAAHAPSG
jgi:hypothetical protein